MTVQLPLFNEMYVAARLLDSIAQLDYPHDKLEIQVLDDSTDETQEICRAKVAELRGDAASTSSTSTASTAPASRPARSSTASRSARGEFVMVFDADFVPPADILERTVHFFTERQGRHGAGALGPPEPRLLARSPSCRR